MKRYISAALLIIVIFSVLIVQAFYVPSRVTDNTTVSAPNVLPYTQQTKYPIFIEETKTFITQYAALTIYDIRPSEQVGKAEIHFSLKNKSDFAVNMENFLFEFISLSQNGVQLRELAHTSINGKIENSIPARKTKTGVYTINVKHENAPIVIELHDGVGNENNAKLEIDWHVPKS